jgi:hypothetical protein
VRTCHQPVIGRIEDGRWVVTCQDCHRDRESSPPIGIDLPVTSLMAAQLMRDNHAGRPASNDGPSQPDQPEVSAPRPSVKRGRTSSRTPAVA